MDCAYVQIFRFLFIRGGVNVCHGVVSIVSVYGMFSTP